MEKDSVFLSDKVIVFCVLFAAFHQFDKDIKAGT